MIVQCPSCSRQFDAADDSAGQVISCPSCAGQMQLPSAALRAATNASAETKPCRKCGKAILQVAKKCKHCGTFVVGAARPTAALQNAPAPRGRLRQRRPGDGRMALVFALIGLVPLCAVICNVAGLTRSLWMLEMLIFLMPVFALLAVIYGFGARRHDESRRLGTAGLVLGLAEFGFLLLAVIFVAFRWATR